MVLALLTLLEAKAQSFKAQPKRFQLKSQGLFYESESTTSRYLGVVGHSNGWTADSGIFQLDGVTEARQTALGVWLRLHDTICSSTESLAGRH
jgi:hypothetical protein